MYLLPCVLFFLLYYLVATSGLRLFLLVEIVSSTACENKMSSHFTCKFFYRFCWLFHSLLVLLAKWKQRETSIYKFTL